MARRTVEHHSVSYLVSDDDMLAPERRWWAVLRTRAVDEITGEAPRVPVSISTTTARCMPRAGSDGFCGLVARPVDIGPALTVPGALTAEIHAPGFLPRSLTAAIDAARRVLPAGANAGDAMLDVAPPDPPLVPSDTASRLQFRPGRGVMLARPAPAGAEEFGVVSDPVTPPAATEVPLMGPVRGTHAINTRVAGVPVVLADQALHRTAQAALRGRVRRQPSAGAMPISAPGANVGIVGAWWTLPEVRGNSTPPHAPDFVSTVAPLSFDHPAGATVHRCTLTPEGVVRRLAAAAYPRAREILLENWSGLTAAGGDVLRLELSSSGEIELVVLDAFTPPTQAGNPARIPLRTPLAFPHASGCAAERMALADAGTTTLAREALRGDRTIFTATLAGVPASAVLRIGSGTPEAELRFVERVPTFAGGAFPLPAAVHGDGTFTFPALGRVAQLRLRIEHAGQTAETVDVALDYDGNNTVEILLKP